MAVYTRTGTIPPPPATPTHASSATYLRAMPFTEPRRRPFDTIRQISSEIDVIKWIMNMLVNIL